MIQLLLGLAMGLSVLSAASVWVGLQWQSHQRQLQQSQYQHDVRTLMDTLVADIKRANFKGYATSTGVKPSTLCPSDFCNSADDFNLTAHQVLFSIDRNDNGIKDNNECSGFRQNGKLIQTKTSCSPVVWTSLTTLKTLEVNDLRFQLLCMPDGLTASSVILISLSIQTTFQSMPTDWQRYVQLRNQHWSVLSPPCDALVG
jgi:type IV pilus assembly protein PilW